MVHAPPLAWNVVAVPPGEPLPTSVADLPNGSVVGTGKVKCNVGDSRIATMSCVTEAAVNCEVAAVCAVTVHVPEAASIRTTPFVIEQTAGGLTVKVSAPSLLVVAVGV